MKNAFVRPWPESSGVDPIKGHLMKSIRGVLLDVDGTLVDSNDAHARAWVRALAENGFEVPYEEVRRRIGMGGDKLLPEVTGGVESESADGKKIGDRRKAIFQEDFLPSLRAFPQAKELLVRMKAAGLKLAAASSAKKDELGPLLRVCGADEILDGETSSDDAENSKPDPDILHAALSQLDLPADRVIMLGDTPYDVQAAQKGGITVVAFRCGGWGDADLAGAAAVYDGPADLLARFDSSPFVR
jgi:HAD superfamily hydrolase (TIGR01509 family)